MKWCSVRRCVPRLGRRAVWGGELPERGLCGQRALHGSGGQALVPSTEPRVPLKGGPLLQICPCQDWPQSGGVPDSTLAPTRKAGQSGSAWS